MKNILIVDDSSLVRRMIREVLEDHADWNVCGEAANGREGVAMALQLSPDLVLLDLCMPIMNGFEAAREMKRSKPGMPILVFTSLLNSEIESEALAAGASAVQSKCDGAESLCKSIGDLLETAA